MDSSGVLAAGIEQCNETVNPAVGCVAVEQFGAVFEQRIDDVTTFLELEQKIELGRSAADVDRLHLNLR